MSTEIYNLCVVGAGIFGSAAARHASANAGVKVCLVGPDEPTPKEKPNRDIFGAHYDEGRITRYLDGDIPNVILSRESIKRYRELEKLSGIQFYHPVGLIWSLKKDSTDLKKLQQASDILKLPIVDLSYNDIFEKRFPYIKLQDDDYPLLDDFGAGHISPRSMVAAQKKVAKEQGCVLISKAVSEVKYLKDGVHEIVTEDGTTIKAERVLICTGSFTNLKKFPMPKLKIDIYKETVAFLKIPLKEVQRLSAMPTIIYSDPDVPVYILPAIKYPDGNYYIKIGHSGIGKNDKVETLEEIKKWYLSKGDPEKIKAVTKSIKELIPGLSYEEVTSMTCVTCKSPSGQPYIDRISPTVTVAVVGNGKGAKYGDEAGRIAAHLSLTGRWDSELAKEIFSAIVDKETSS